MVKVLYKLFLGVMIALFFGFGIAVFYPAPKAPDYPIELQTAAEKFNTEQTQIQKDFETNQRNYEKDLASYSRNVSAIVIGISIILLALSLTVLLTVDIMGDGILFGGLFTLIYGIIRGFMSNESKFQFIVVTVGLIIAIALGYIKFIKAEKKQK